MLFRALTAVSLAFLYVAPAYTQAGEAADAPLRLLTLKQLWNADARYIDHLHGVTFRFPSAWKAETQFGYWPPALTEAGQTKPTAGLGYTEGGFPREHSVGPYSATNLEGFGVVYLAVPATSESACEIRAASLSQTSKHRMISFGGRSFSEHDTVSAGMSQSNSGKLYATYLGSTCYLFETDVAVSSGALDVVRALTPEQSRLIETNLLAIMKSVRIAPPEQRKD